MKLGLGGGGSDAKQSPILIVVLVVVILAAVFFVARNFIGGGGQELPAPGTVPMPGMPGPGVPGAGPGGPGMPPPPGPGPGPEGMPSPGAPAPVAPPPGGVEGAPASPPAPPAAAPGAGSARPSAPQPVASASPASSAQPAPSPTGRVAAPKGPTQSIKVFRTVTVDVPEGWRVDIAAAKTAAVFTNGRAHFEVHAPDPKAASAKEIADSAVRTLGGTVSAESAENVAGHSAHVYSLTRGGATTRVVGLDAPTRVVLVAYVRGGSFSDYQSAFDQMQSSLKFSTP